MTAGQRSSRAPMALLRRRIGPGLTLLRGGGFPRVEKTLRHRGETEVWIGIGGNVGEVRRRFERLRHFLKRSSDLRLLESSPILVNPPFGYLDQPDFLNAVLRIATALPPRALLRRLLRIERRFGRRRSFPNAPRTLDLDILFYGERRVRRKDLTIPHPHWRERESVTIPLAQMRRRPRLSETLRSRGATERRKKEQ